MAKHNQDGSINGLAISLMMTGFLLVISLVFGFWAFSSRQDYKNNVDAKVNAAVNQATEKQTQIDAAAYNLKQESPLTTYNGPSTYGSIVVNYPKSWSAYVDDSGTGNALVDGYFNPGYVHSISDQSSIFALRVEVINQPYSQVLTGFSGGEQQGALTAKAYSLPKLPSVLGVEVSGTLATTSQPTNVTMVVLPLRAETVEIWTEGSQYLYEFNNDILPYFSFSP